MIKILIGLPGQGKTVTAVKFIKDRPGLVFTNFDVKLPNVIRLKWEHLITYDVDDKGKKTNTRVNWEFWRNAIKQYGGFDIILDELQNIMHSRRSSSVTSVIMTSFVSQIRKITGSNENHHFIVISQELERIDIAVRDLASEIIVCDKRQSSPRPTKILSNEKIMTIDVAGTYIRLTYFIGKQCVQRYCDYRDLGSKSYDHRTMFYANPFIHHYDSYSIVDFGDETHV